MNNLFKGIMLVGSLALSQGAKTEEHIKLSEALQKDTNTLVLNILDGNYVDTSYGFDGIKKVNKSLETKEISIKLYGDIVTEGGDINKLADSLQILELPISNSDKTIKLLYGISKQGENYTLYLFKKFGENDYKYEEIKLDIHRDQNSEINFKRTGIGGFDKNIGNLTANITIKWE